MKRSILVCFWIFALLFVVILTFVSCNTELNNGTQENTEKEQATEKESESRNSETELNSDDNEENINPWTLACSSIFYPDKLLAWEKNSIDYLMSKISFSAEEVLTDVRSDRQIIIGRYCLDDELLIADYDKIGYNGYSIFTFGERLVITAKTDKGLFAAIDKLISDVKDGAIPYDYSVTVQEEFSKTEPNEQKHINVKIDADSGYDVYKVPKVMPNGYRYGPSIIVNDDGSIDMWLASSGCGVNQWDWITYMHSDDGVNWTDERVVLQPTPNGYDHLSCCDPGVIYFNGYYYLGYTSTPNAGQADNSVFVARSENPYGPFEKWNGNGWGGDNPVPIIFYDESAYEWGAGEPSFVELNGTLFIYYTWVGSEGHMIYTSTADSTDPNWPKTVEFQGVAVSLGSNDSVDVKYFEEYGKFIAVTTDKRLTPDSYLAFYESNDGISFSLSSICKKNVYYYCHNSGIAGSPDGHIRAGQKQLVGYAYGKEWGTWNTRLQEIEISISDEIDLTEENEDNIHKDISRDERDASTLPFSGITCIINEYYVIRKGTSTTVSLYTFTSLRDKWYDLSIVGGEDKVIYNGYDENIIKCEDGQYSIEAVNSGITLVTATWRGFSTSFCVIVTTGNNRVKESAIKPFVKDSFFIDTDSIKYSPQIKAIVEKSDGTWLEAYGADMLTFEGYDDTVISIDENGIIIPKREGKTSIKVSYGALSYQVLAEIRGESLKYDYSNMDFADKAAILAIGQLHNASFEVLGDCLKIVSTTGSDPFVYFTYSCLPTNEYTSVTIEYMIPDNQSRDSYSGQLFFVAGSASVESEQCSKRESYISDGNWHTVTFNFSDNPGFEGPLKKLRFDFFDFCSCGDVMYIKSIKLN